MDNRYTIDESTLVGIADAIREKTNSNAKYSPEEMPDAIKSIGPEPVLPFVSNVQFVTKTGKLAQYDINTNTLLSNDESAVVVNYDIDYTKPWKVHIKFSLNATITKIYSLIGCHVSNNKAPSVQLQPSRIWVGYSYGGSGWDITESIQYDMSTFTPNVVYDLDYYYDGVDSLCLVIMDGSTELINQVYTVSGPHFTSTYKMALGKNYNFDYGFNGNLYLDDCYVLNDGQVIFGREQTS